MAKITLADYASDRDGVVLFWCSVGTPMGDYSAIGDEWLDTDDDWMGAEGTVDAAGDWRWDGRGDFRDGRGNSVLKLHAYVDAARFSELAS